MKRSPLGGAGEGRGWTQEFADCTWGYALDLGTKCFPQLKIKIKPIFKEKVNIDWN